MRDRDRQILVKILKYCDEVIIANELYHSDKELFEDEKQGFVYKNSVCMSILQIGELSKNLSEEFARQYPGIPLKVMARMRDILVKRPPCQDHGLKNQREPVFTILQHFGQFSCATSLG